MSIRTHLSMVGAALAAVALAAPASAQSGSGWTAFVGCWQPLDAGDEAGLLCFRPSGVGVEMFNVVGGEVVATELIVANGSQRPVSAEGCTGFESASFSEDSQRVFTRSQFNCSDELRTGSGVMSFVAPTQWIDVRSLDVSGEPVAWVQRYQLADADEMAEQGIDDPAAFDRTLVRAMRTRAAQAIDVADVEEAAAVVDTRAVEVWVAANETELELSGSELIRLADSGLPESLIDVMVAVSYPERFVLTPEGAEEADRMAMERGYDYGYRRGYRSYLWGPYYRPIGFGYYGYAPYGYYGYGGWGGYYGGYYGYRPATVIVQPAGGSSDGRMVPGRGYTRGSSSNVGSGSAGPRSSVGAPARSSGSGGSGSASSGSGSSGSSRPSGRTAQPRRDN